MAEESGQERTEQATPKRLREAREKGDVARSRELATMAVLLGGAGAALIFGRYTIGRLTAMMRHGLAPPPAVVMDPSREVAWLGNALVEAFVAVLPILGVLVVAALVSPFVLGGISFSAESLMPKLEKLDPVQGIKRVFSLNGLMEFVKALAKFLVISAVAYAVLRHDAPTLMRLARESLDPALAGTAGLLAWSFLLLAGALLLIAAADVPFQLWDHSKKLRMTRQEVRDESKETEGNPQMRARVRRVQREMSQRRMMEAVPTADVVVTNPTHFAVALRYDETRAGAPRVVAKGRDLIAAEIRRRAEAAGVALIPAPPLARALYRNTELDAEVPRALYMAVAQVLAYVYQVKAGATPAPLSALPVPPDLTGDAENPGPDGETD